MKALYALLLALPVLAVAAEVKLSSPNPKGVPNKTTITSQTLEMVSGVGENVFYFSKNVHVVNAAIDMKADQMVVTATRAPGSDLGELSKPTSGKGQFGAIEKIVGVGNVQILQEGRQASAGRAECFPKLGKVVLTESPRVVDSQAIVSGWRITLTQGDKRVIVEQDPNSPEAMRPTINLDNTELPKPAEHPTGQILPRVAPAMTQPGANTTAPVLVLPPPPPAVAQPIKSITL